MRLLWTEYNEKYSIPGKQQPLAKIVDEFAKNPDSIDFNQNNFFSAQFAYWDEAQALGNPWKITDFITLGAALNAVDYLMVNEVPVEKLIFQRELPTCPPEVDEEENTIFYRKQFQVEGKINRKGIDVPHHGAMFSMIRWTNIYYKSDFVGGPMQRLFGKGVRDIEIPHKSLWFYPGGHTSYWNGKIGNQAIKEIVNALNLNIGWTEDSHDKSDHHKG